MLRSEAVVVRGGQIEPIVVLGQFEREGVAGFRARFGLVVEGITGQNLGPGLTLEDAIDAGETVLFSLDAVTCPTLATKIGAWVLLDLGASPRNGPDRASSSSTSSQLWAAKAGT